MIYLRYYGSKDTRYFAFKSFRIIFYEVRHQDERVRIAVNWQYYICI